MQGLETKKEEIVKAQTEEHRDAEDGLVGKGRLKVSTFHFDEELLSGGGFGILNFSFYDSKPFQMMSTAHNQVGFTLKKRKVWDYEVKMYKEIEYFRLVIVDEYNHRMDGVDLQDQLRWYYRVDGKRMWRWRKWKCSIQRLCKALLILNFVTDRIFEIYIWLD